MIKGTVKWFDTRKGYGYITDENGNDYFAHYSAIKKGRVHFGLKDEDNVIFNVINDEKGPKAINVKIVDKDATCNGTVKWFSIRKGYGYITDAEGKDYFVHASDIVDGRKYIGLADNDTITFESESGEKGPQAINIELV